MQTPKKFSSFSDQVSWISDEKGIKIKDREYAEEMLRQIGYFPLMGGYKHLFRISNTKKYKAGTSFEEIVSLYKFDAELRELFFKYLLQIERQMRSLMSYYFTEMYGAEQKQYRTVDAIADTPLHKKLSLPQSGNQYEKGKQDLFAVVIAFRYLLPGKDFLEFKRKLIKEIDRVNREVEPISEVELLNKMGFPKNWKNITRYHLN